MGAPERIVRHLRLRADSETSVRRAALKLEDALRCASLPDVGERLLLVRRLDLGLLADGASPQTLSLLLEQRVAAVGGTWVHGADPNAHRADFVFFRDALEARCELALRLARAVPCATWFWLLAVPEFKVVDFAQANLRRMALAIAALPEAPVALPAWIARLTTAGVVPVLAQAIGPVEGAALLRAAHLAVDTPRSRDIQMASSKLPQLASSDQDAYHREVSPRRELAPAFLALPIWLRTLARAGGFVPPVVLVVPVVYVAQAGRAAVPNQTVIEPTRLRHSGVEIASRLVGPETSANDMHEPPVSRQTKGDTEHLPGLPDDVSAEAALGSSPIGRPFSDAVASSYAGLLFLLPVLQRLDYAAWADTLPDGAAAQVVQRLLALVLQRLQSPSDDPAWLLAGTPLNHDFCDIECKAPASWGEPPLAAPRGSAAKDIVALAEQARSTTALAHLWLIACRRWLWRVAGIGVASLVVRPGATGLTATHADVFFRLSDADIRVRRAGLDLDLGWVPWIGRVVTFHYDHEERA